MKFLTVLASSIFLMSILATPSLAASTAPKVNAAQGVSKSSKITLTEAINIARKSAKGYLNSVDFDDDAAKYEIQFLSNNTSYEVTINALTGKVLGVDKDKLDKEDIRQYNALKNTKINLYKAIDIAARSLSGDVIEAEFDVIKTTPVYKIKVVKTAREYVALVNANTGKVISSQRD